MTAVSLVTLVALVVLVVVPLYLVFAVEYRDGLIGRISLACMSVAAVGKLMLYWAYGAPLIAGGTGELMLWAVAVFMLRHAMRYWQWSRAGRCGWDSKECAQAPVPAQKGTPTEEEDRPIPHFLRRDGGMAATVRREER